VHANANLNAAAAARRDQAVLKVYERFEAPCDDLDSGLFDLNDQHCFCCMEIFAGAASGKTRKVAGHVWSGRRRTPQRPLQQWLPRLHRVR
jgi:hypothetical protein